MDEPARIVLRNGRLDVLHLLGSGFEPHNVNLGLDLSRREVVVRVKQLQFLQNLLHHAFDFVLLLGRHCLEGHPLYDRMLDNIEPTQQNIILCILGYVALASRPLSLDELVFLVRCQQPGLSVTEIDVQALVEDSEPLMHMTGQTVSLVHESVRGYVKKGVLHDGLCLVPEEMHLHFSRACIKALEHETSLVKYAIKYWPEHARRAETLADHLISGHRWFFDTQFAASSMVA